MRNLFSAYPQALALRIPCFCFRHLSEEKTNFILKAKTIPYFTSLLGGEKGKIEGRLVKVPLSSSSSTASSPEPQKWRIIGIHSAKIASGKFDFVVDEANDCIVGELHHTLAKGEKVKYAGEVTFDNDGVIRHWTNRSGHYQPHPGFSHHAPFPEQLFYPEHVTNEIRAKSAVQAALDKLVRANRDAEEKEQMAAAATEARAEQLRNALDADDDHAGANEIAFAQEYCAANFDCDVIDIYDHTERPDRNRLAAAFNIKFGCGSNAKAVKRLVELKVLQRQ